MKASYGLLFQYLSNFMLEVQI